jgi:hypothetical protein
MKFLLSSETELGGSSATKTLMRGREREREADESRLLATYGLSSRKGPQEYLRERCECVFVIERDTERERERARERDRQSERDRDRDKIAVPF